MGSGITEEERIMYDETRNSVADAFRVMYKNAKGSKKDFSNFILHYNENKADYANLSEDEVAALRNLRGMWNGIGRSTGLDYYFQMKDCHTIVNGPLLKDPLWAK